jgi:signal transduction histidine kinase
MQDILVLATFNLHFMRNTGNKWIRLCLIGLFVIISSVSAAAQSPVGYIKKLEQSSTKENFERTFKEMMVVFKAGQMSFNDEQVAQILAVARQKPYAEFLLPYVYGWAGTMFGDGRMDVALLYFMESADLYARRGKDLAHALSCFEIALIHHKAENYDEAKSYYQRTLKLASDSLDHRTRINCYNGFALIQRHKLQLDSAAIDFRKAYQIAEMNADTAWMGILLGNIGSIHMRRENYDSSLYYYQMNLSLVRNTAEFENEIETYSHLARIYLLKSDFNNAKSYVDSAANIISTRKIKLNDFFNPLDYIHETYASLYAATGDYKNAFNYYQKFHKIAEDKQEHVNGRSLKQLQSAFTFEQKQHELELLKEINQANLLVINHQRYIGGAFACIILLMSTLAFILYRTGRQRKKLNTKLCSSNEELERLNTVKDRLFSVISHDLRSPIATLRSLMIFLQDGNIKPSELAFLYSKLNHQLEVSGNVLDNLLHWAKAEMSDVKTDLEKVILADVVNNVALQLREMMEQKNTQLHNELKLHLAALADRVQVEIILRNLIAKAVKFTPPGGIIRIDGKVSNACVEIYVEDNGMGMHEEQVRNLFQPGRSFTTVGTNDEKGAGIGLIITKEMISKNGGNIWVNSRKHTGTKFTFTLPIAS